MVSVLLNDQNKAGSRSARFMRNRTAAAGLGHYLLVGSTLKPDESSVDSLSDFLIEAGTKGSCDISVLCFRSGGNGTNLLKKFPGRETGSVFL